MRAAAYKNSDIVLCGVFVLGRAKKAESRVRKAINMKFLRESVEFG